MTNVVLFSEQPVLAAGLRAVVDGLEDFTVSAVCTTLDSLMECVQTRRPSVVLLEVTDAAFDILTKVKLISGDTPTVLWVDDVPTDFVSQALALGVRGILRKSLPIELQIKCLHKVAGGDLWVEQGLCERLLTSDRVVLTRRERQLANLLGQGLKNKEIAFALHLSEGTIKVYLSRLFHKVGVHDRLELALYALKNCFAEPALQSDVALADGRVVAKPRPSPFCVPVFMSAQRPVANAQAEPFASV